MTARTTTFNILKAHRCRSRLQTEVPHIYAVGDVIGFPALAATSMEQGRLAAYHACGEPVPTAHTIQPIGISSIPEISFAGQTEDQQDARDHPAVQR
jgi:pyruvate/2-oxoglutarate dehydrogenase complex dihydrolipoamide dehydrogenase (E3) component